MTACSQRGAPADEALGLPGPVACHPGVERIQPTAWDGAQSPVGSGDPAKDGTWGGRGRPAVSEAGKIPNHSSDYGCLVLDEPLGRRASSKSRDGALFREWRKMRPVVSAAAREPGC
jgi:hypothetical protein